MSDLVFSSGDRELSEVEQVLNAIEDILTSEDFDRKRTDFIGEYSHLFPEDGDIPVECMGVYKKYIEMVENEILSKIKEKFPRFEFDSLIPAITNDKKLQFIHMEFYDMLNALNDFQAFRDLMVSYEKGKGMQFDIITTHLEDIDQ